MDFNEKYLKDFLSEEGLYKIPTYQRAYSWEEKQLKQFWYDLKDRNSFNKMQFYSFGNIILEKENDKVYNIIDGQQRLTTIYIFLRSLLNIAIRRNMSDFNEIKNYFIKAKLETVHYDQLCFKKIIIENKEHDSYDTLSQKRIIQAKRFFMNQLHTISNDNLKSLYQILINSKINKIVLSSKKEAALTFELQNNRGKDLTNLEKLKSYFMYQLNSYSHSSKVEDDISYISSSFDKIYSTIYNINKYLNNNDHLSMTEDEIFLYHCQSHTDKKFQYRNITDIFEEFKEIPITDENGGIQTGLEEAPQVTWIKKFVDDLYDTFSNIQDILRTKDYYFEKIKRLDYPSFVWPFIILGKKFYKDDKTSLSELFRIMEVLGFRYKIVRSRADIRSRCTEIIKEFIINQDIDNLAKKIEDKMNEAWYWGDEKFNDVLNENLFGNKALNYLLWEYEEDLLIKGYEVGSIDDETIEHISPQTEKEEWVEPGYEVDEHNHYTDEFRSKYLNCIGNLLLASRSHNSSLGNSPFRDKLKSFSENPLIKQQIELKKYITNKNHPEWKHEQIENRKTDIIKFANKRWCFTKAYKKNK